MMNYFILSMWEYTGVGEDDDVFNVGEDTKHLTGHQHLLYEFE